MTKEKKDPITTDLKKAANMKLKLDILQEQYDELISNLKKQMQDQNTTITDPNGVLGLEIIENNKRSFNVEGVRNVLGDLADKCINETVDAKKFDILTKEKGKSTLSEEKQKLCFTSLPIPQIKWIGLDVYKGGLMRDLEKNNG